MAKKTGTDKELPAKKGVIGRLFSAWKKEDPEAATGLAEGSGGYSGYASGTRPFMPGEGVRNEDGKLESTSGLLMELAGFVREVPAFRLMAYDLLDMMAQDSTIDSALKMHISHALSAKTDTGEMVFIESVNDAEDEIVNDLRNTFKDLLNNNVERWAYQAALYGVSYIRPYIRQGEGVVHIRHDYYTHPSHVKEFERAGMLVGYTCEHQRSVEKKGQLRLMEPWKLISFKIPQYTVPTAAEPMRLYSELFDMDNDDYMSESPVETQNYGSSLVIKAYSPWIDLNEGLLALNSARRNSAKKDRFVGVNIGKDNPRKAAEYFNTVASQFKKTAQDRAKQALSRGYISTTDTKLYPIASTGSGRLEIQTEDSPVDITSIADIDYHTSRLCAALGVDKSLLGYTADMSGGLGEGGFFRMSILAAIKANMIRSAITEGVEKLFEVHVAIKYGRVYPDGEKPWKLIFNSLNTAIEKEEADARESRVNFATSVAGLIQLLDQELETVKKPEFFNWMFTDLLKVDEEKFKAMIQASKATGGDGEMPEPEADKPPPVLDSAFGAADSELKQLIYKCIAEVFNDE